MARGSTSDPPARLVKYGESLLRQRTHYATMLIKWALRWAGEIQDFTAAAALDALAHAKALRRYAWALENMLEDAAIAAMHHEQTSHHRGVDYEAVLRPGTDRSGWDHEGVMNELVDRTVTKIRRRFPDLPARTVRQIATEAAWSVHEHGRIEWRSTDLRRSGIEPDDFSRRTFGSASVDLRGAAAYTDGVNSRRHNPRMEKVGPR